MSEVCYERLRPRQIAEVRTKWPLAYLPIGTIEWHGVHNPTGLDTIKAHKLCTLAAQQGGGLVFPPLWYGEHREMHLVEANPVCRDQIARLMKFPADNLRRGYMGEQTISDQANTYLSLLNHVFHEIRSLGFEAIFVLCGHYPLATYAQLAGMVFSRDTGVEVVAAGEHELVVGQDLGGQIGDHAARWETSLLMHLEPGLTDLSELAKDSGEAALGIGGEDPSESSQQFGARATKAIVDVMVKQANALLHRHGTETH